MPRPKSIPGEFLLTVTERKTLRTILSVTYQDLNEAMKAARGFTAASALRRHWYSVTITDVMHHSDAVLAETLYISPTTTDAYAQKQVLPLQPTPYSDNS